MGGAWWCTSVHRHLIRRSSQQPAKGLCHDMAAALNARACTYPSWPVIPADQCSERRNGVWSARSTTIKNGKMYHACPRPKSRHAPAPHCPLFALGQGVWGNPRLGFGQNPTWVLGRTNWESHLGTWDNIHRQQSLLPAFVSLNDAALPESMRLWPSE